MTPLAVNGRYLGQPVTGVQRYAVEVTAALERTLGPSEVVVLRPPSPDPVRSRVWELVRLAPAARRSTGSVATLNLCNWGPIRGLDRATVVVHDAAVHELAGGFSQSYRVLARAWMAFLRRSGARVVTVSERSREVLEQLLDRTVTVASCGVDVAAAEQHERRGQRWLESQGLAEEPYALLVGAHDRRKNLPFALSLLADLRERGLRLVVTHRSGALSLRNTNLTSTPDQVRMIADPNDDQLWALYGGAAVLLHPSMYEGFGLPMLEAAAVGTPFVSSPVGAAEDLAVDPRQVVPLDPAAWSRALDAVLAERETLARLSRAGAAGFTWDRTARAILTAVDR